MTNIQTATTILQYNFELPVSDYKPIILLLTVEKTNLNDEAIFFNISTT